MSYPVDELPDLSSIGGEWIIATAHKSSVQVGIARFPDWEWPYHPDECRSKTGGWYLDIVMLCNGCGADGT